MTQLAIDLQYRTAFGRADFLVSACNAEALGWVERWPDWPAPALLIHGPPGSGKTHLAHLWQVRCGGIIVPAETLDALEPVLRLAEQTRGIAVDDADRAAEAPLLHLHNWYHERGTSLLLFKRIFGSGQRPDDGYPLDEVGSAPRAYARGGKMSDFERRIWDDFWNIANDPERAYQIFGNNEFGLPPGDTMV